LVASYDLWPGNGPGLFSKKASVLCVKLGHCRYDHFSKYSTDYECSDLDSVTLDCCKIWFLSFHSFDTCVVEHAISCHLILANKIPSVSYLWYQNPQHATMALVI